MNLEKLDKHSTLCCCCCCCCCCGCCCCCCCGCCRCRCRCGCGCGCCCCCCSCCCCCCCGSACGCGCCGWRRRHRCDPEPDNIKLEGGWGGGRSASPPDAGVLAAEPVSFRRHFTDNIKLELVFSLQSLAELLRFATLPFSILDEASQTCWVLQFFHFCCCCCCCCCCCGSACGCGCCGCRRRHRNTPAGVLAALVRPRTWQYKAGGGLGGRAQRLPPRRGCSRCGARFF